MSKRNAEDWANRNHANKMATGRQPTNITVSVNTAEGISIRRAALQVMASCRNHDKGTESMSDMISSPIHATVQ